MDEQPDLEGAQIISVAPDSAPSNDVPDLSTAVPIQEDLAQRSREILSQASEGKIDLTPKQYADNVKSAQAGAGAWQRFGESGLNLLTTLGNPWKVGKLAVDTAKGIGQQIAGSASDNLPLISPFIPTGDQVTSQEVPAWEGGSPEAKKEYENRLLGQNKEETALKSTQFSETAAKLPARVAAGGLRTGVDLGSMAAGVLSEIAALTGQPFGYDPTAADAALYETKHDFQKSITNATGVSSEDPTAGLVETGLFSTVPVGAEKFLAPLVARGAEAIVEGGTKVAGKAVQGGAAAAQKVGPAIVGGELAAHGHPFLGLLAMLRGYTPSRYGWLGGLREMIIDKGLGGVKDLGKVAADAPWGTTVMQHVQNGLSDDVVKLETKIADMRSSAGPEKLPRVDKTHPDGSHLYDLEELSPAEKEIRLNQVKLANAKQGITALNPYIRLNKITSDLAKYGLSSAGNLATAATTGAAMTSASAAPGDLQAQEAGIGMGALFGLPGLHRANVSGRLKMLRNEMIGKGKKLISEDQLAGLTPEQQDSIYAHAAEVAPLGGKIEILSPEEMIQRQSGGSVMLSEEGATAVNGFLQDNPVLSDYNTLFVNRDAIKSGVIGHEFEHLADNQLNLSREKFSQDIQGRIDTGTEAYKNFAQKYLEAKRRSFPNAPELPLEKVNQEVKAEIGRMIKLHMPPEMFYGGRGGGTIVKDWIKGLFQKDTGEIIGKFGGFEAPYTRGDINALKDVFYDIGEKARSGEKVSPSVTTAEPQEKRATEPSSAPTVPSSIVSDATSALKGLGISDPGPKVEAAMQELGPDATLEDVVRKATQRAVPKDLSDISLMPKSDTIDRPASKINDLIFPGTRPQAIKAAKKLGLSDLKIEDGFITVGGKWMTPEEARLHGEERGQLPESLKDRLTPQDLSSDRLFMPSSHYDALKEAAMKFPDGKVFTGYNHADAYAKAERAGYNNPGSLGFVTNSNQFLSMARAAKRAETIGQIPEGTYFIDDNGKISLDSSTLMHKRQFMPAPSKEHDALKSPAIKRKSDGKIFAAKSADTPHWMMPQEHPELRDRYTLGGVDRYTDGWVTNDGEFLDKKQGHARAIEKKQIDPNFKTEYKGALSTLDFNEGRSFMPAVPRAQASAEDYVAMSGIGRIAPPSDARVDINRARRIAKDYEVLPKRDDSPETRKSYEQFVKEVNYQYQHAVDSGIKFEFTRDDPYKNSAEMMADVEHGRLKVYTGGEDHPYLGNSTKDADGLTANDKFRAVHDLYGHASEGNQFGPNGEERAWRKHAAMFSDEARPAMTAETRGQNSWVNYGPHMFDKNGYRGDKSHPNYIPPQDRPFAEQKASLLPLEHSIAEPATLNIGLDVAGGERLNPKEVISVLEKRGVNVARYDIYQSNTEPTLVATLDRPLTPEEAHDVSAELKQGSIAQHFDGQGELYGPGADNWKPFNPDYFLTHEGTRLSDQAPEGTVNAPESRISRPDLSGVSIEPETTKLDSEPFNREGLSPDRVPDYPQKGERHGSIWVYPNPDGTYRAFVFGPEKGDGRIIDKKSLSKQGLSDWIGDKNAQQAISDIRENIKNGAVPGENGKLGGTSLPAGEFEGFKASAIDVPSEKLSSVKLLENSPESFKGKTIEAGEEPWSIRLKELADKEWNGTKLTNLEEKELVDLHKEAAKNYGSYQNWFERMGGEKDYLGKVFGEGEQKNVQFMPSDHPDAIDETAIRMEDGTIFKGGPMHVHAEEEALSSGYKERDLDRATDGWVDKKGNFLDRWEAGARARQIGQVVKSELQSRYNDKTGIMEERPFLESMHFEDNRRFMPAPHIEREAERLGLRYDGNTEYKGTVIHNYTDPITKSTIAVKQDAERGELQKKLAAKRDLFKNAQYMPSTVEDAVSRVPIYPSNDDYAHTIYSTKIPLKNVQVDMPPHLKALESELGLSPGPETVPVDRPEGHDKAVFAKLENPRIVIGHDYGKEGMWWSVNDEISQAKSDGNDGVIAIHPKALPIEIRKHAWSPFDEPDKARLEAMDRFVKENPDKVDWEHSDNEVVPFNKPEDQPGVAPDKILDRFNEGKITKEQMGAALRDASFMPSGKYEIAEEPDSFSEGGTVYQIYRNGNERVGKEFDDYDMAQEALDELQNKEHQFMPGPIGAAKDFTSKIAADTEEEFWNNSWPKLMKSTGLQLSSKNEKNINEAAKRSVDDVRKFLDENPRFKDYYNKDWGETKKLLDEYYGRELTGDDLTFFKLAKGLTSPNTSLQVNVADALNVTDQYLKDGNLDSIKMGVSPKGNRVLAESPVSISGNTNAIKAFSLKAIDGLSKELGGPKKVADYLIEPVSVSELQDFNKSLGYKGDVGKLGSIKELVEQATGQSEKIPRMFVFGRKVGAYTLNLLGEHKYQTIDTWESRFIRSHFKDMFTGVNALPKGKDEHAVFTKFSQLFNEEFNKQTGLNLDNSALQAARWFFILDSSRKMGYTGSTTAETISHYVNEQLSKRRDKSRGIGDLEAPTGDETLPDNPF